MEIDGLRDTELIHYPNYNVNQRSLLVNGRTQMNGNLTINGNISVNSTNIALGLDAGSITVGTNTVDIGNQAGQANLGTDSVAIGYLTSVTRLGSQSTAVGSYAGYNQTGTYNTFFGREAGYFAGSQMTGGNNTYLGYNTSANSSGYTNSTAIGTGAIITASSQIKLGNGETVVIPGATTATGLITANGGITTGTINGYGFTYIPWTNIYYNIGTGGSLSSVLTAVTTMPTPSNNANTRIQYMYSVVGKCLFMRFVYYSTVAGTAGSGNYKYLLPSPYNTSGLWPQILNNINENFHITRIGTATLNNSGSAFAMADVRYTIYNSQNCMAIENETNDQGSGNYAYSYAGTSNYSFEAMLPLA